MTSEILLNDRLVQRYWHPAASASGSGPTSAPGRRQCRVTAHGFERYTRPRAQSAVARYPGVSIQPLPQCLSPPEFLSPAADQAIGGRPFMFSVVDDAVGDRSFMFSVVDDA